MIYTYHILAFLAIFSLLGYAIYTSDENDITNVINETKKLKDMIAGITVTSPAGDIAKINANEPTVKQEQVYVNDNTGEELTEEELVEIAVLKGIPDDDIILLTIEGGSSFGFTTKYKNTELSADHYQIGNPIVFSGLLKKVIPDSCEIDDETDELICKYIEPAKFQYTFTISCKFREACTLSDIQRSTEETNNDGTWSQKIQTNPTMFSANKNYKMTVEANSEAINPTTQRPYLIIVEKIFYMVG